MVEILEKINWFIYNGCGKKNREEMWMYAGARGKSVLNYEIADGEVWNRVLRVEVVENVNLDYFPVVISIKEEGRVKKRSQKVRN